MDDAVEIIENKQKELCPVGRYSKNYLTGLDREKYDEWEDLIDAVNSIPTIDADPVRHGHWKTGNSWAHQVCSVCSFDVPYHILNYCPHCGAKMDKVSE